MVDKPFVTLEVDPQAKLREFLAKAQEKVSDLTIPLHLISQQWFKSNRAIFSLVGPGKYPPFKGPTDPTPYQKRKLKKYGWDYPLLKAGGFLEQSITNPTDADAVNYIINKVSLFVGTAVPYAIYHQSKQPRSVMPYRPMILFGNEQVADGALAGRVEQWKVMIAQYVARVNKGQA